MIVVIIVNEKPVTCELRNVLSEPVLTYSLLSVTVMVRAGLKKVSESGSCSVYQVTNSLRREHIVTCTITSLQRVALHMRR